MQLWLQELLFCNASIGTNIMFKPKMMSWGIIETLNWLVAPSTHGRQLNHTSSFRAPTVSVNR